MGGKCVNLKLKHLVSLILVLTIIVTGCTYLDKTKDNIENNEIYSTYEENRRYNTLIVQDYNGIDINDVNHYKIDVQFNPDKKTYIGNQEVSYVNNENVPLREIYFHLYPNAFSDKETAPFLFNDFSNAYPNGFIPGNTNIRKVMIGDANIDYSISGKGNTILKIPLDKPIKPKQKILIYMEYEVKMPPAQDRFGYGDNTYNFGNWYPVAAVYDHEGWNLDPYYSIGDPFYSDTSIYDVKITVPKDIEIASSGNILFVEEKGSNKIWNIEAKLMRDFAWVASKNFIKLEKEIDGTIIKSYCLEDNKAINNLSLEIACEAIETFNKLYGKYPYGQFSVVATSFPSGMEYPGIVFIGEQYYNKFSKEYLEIVIVHETAHQWWYGVVGNDQIDEAWLDESIVTYSESIFAEQKYGKKAGKEYFKNNIENNYNGVKTQYEFDDVVVKSLDQFENWGDYGSLVYNKGAMFLNEIRNKYGDEIFFNILQQYYDRFRFKSATTEDFINICEEITNESLQGIVDIWLYGK